MPQILELCNGASSAADWNVVLYSVLLKRQSLSGQLHIVDGLRNRNEDCIKWEHLISLRLLGRCFKNELMSSHMCVIR